MPHLQSSYLLWTGDSLNADPMTLVARLSAFRSSYSRVELGHGSDSWRYWRGGAPGDAVLWLTGALGVGEFAFLHALRIGAAFRVLVPDYPPVSALNRVSDGLAALLDAERLGAVHVVGGSFGGMVAQHFVRRFPERVRSLVLSHTTAPHPSYLRAGLMRAVSLLVPERPYRALVSRRLRGSFLAADPFWAGYFDSTLEGLTKADLVSRVTLASEFLQSHLRPTDLEGWPGRVLIMSGDDDSLMPPASHAALRRLYPTASAHTFSGLGHSAAILQPEEYVEVIRQYLAARAP